MNFYWYRYVTGNLEQKLYELVVQGHPDVKTALEALNDKYKETPYESQRIINDALLMTTLTNAKGISPAQKIKMPSDIKDVLGAKVWDQPRRWDDHDALDKNKKNAIAVMKWSDKSSTISFLISAGANIDRVQDRLINNVRIHKYDFLMTSAEYFSPFIRSIEDSPFSAQQKKEIYQSLLVRAVDNEFSGIVGALLDKGADPNGKWWGDYETNETLLDHTIRTKRYRAAEKLLAGGANVNLAGHAPLLIAINVNDPIMVELLLKNGADVHRNNNEALKAKPEALKKQSYPAPTHPELVAKLEEKLKADVKGFNENRKEINKLLQTAALKKTPLPAVKTDFAPAATPVANVPATSTVTWSEKTLFMRETLDLVDELAGSKPSSRIDAEANGILLSRLETLPNQWKHDNAVRAGFNSAETARTQATMQMLEEWQSQKRSVTFAFERVSGRGRSGRTEAGLQSEIFGKETLTALVTRAQTVKRDWFANPVAMNRSDVDFLRSETIDTLKKISTMAERDESLLQNLKILAHEWERHPELAATLIKGEKAVNIAAVLTDWGTPKAEMDPAHPARLMQETAQAIGLLTKAKDSQAATGMVRPNNPSF
jgi:ankyrin repeat protein